MKINLIEWLINEYKFDINLLKKEILYSFKHKNLGMYSNQMTCLDIYGLRSKIDLIDRIFIWSHSDKTFSISFNNINREWVKFITSNRILNENIYINFNFFKKKLKIKFEGE